MGGGGGMLKNDASLSFSVQDWGVGLANVTIYKYMSVQMCMSWIVCVDIIIIIIGITTSLHYANIN